MDERMYAKAQKLRPILRTETVYPKYLVSFVPDESVYQGWRREEIGEYCRGNIVFKNGRSVILDFGKHLVGYLQYTISTVEGVADSPAELKFTFGETPYEVMTPPEDYHGTLGSGWLQNETRKQLYLPHTQRLERRYAFRYLKIDMPGSWTGYQVRLDDIFVTAVSAVSMSDVAPLPDSLDERLRKIDEVSLNTLKDCMQDVFEDGPKRDCRLWMGDLRLQALANYYTFRNNDLVKRCLYLFAAVLIDGQVVAPCIYPDSAPFVCAGPITDYALLFPPTLWDYYEATGDKALVEELFEVAVKQIDYGERLVDEEGMLHGFLLIDWAPIDKTTSGQGVWIFALKQAVKLAKLMDREDLVDRFEGLIVTGEKALLRCYDEELGLFVSGEKKEISWATQVWAVLADVMPKEEARELMKRTIEAKPEIAMKAPYMNHYYVEALFACGMAKEAEQKIKGYWGKMIDLGADCFFEVYDPDNQWESPYKDPVINSNCHAWSCTPTYFIRKYLI